MRISGDEHARQLSMMFNEVNTLAIARVHMHTTAEPNFSGYTCNCLCAQWSRCALRSTTSSTHLLLCT